MPGPANAPLNRATRRDAIRRLTTFVAGSPLVDPAAFAQAPPGAPGGRQGGAGRGETNVIRPPEYRPEIMRVINLHEFEDAAKKVVAVVKEAA